MRCFWCEKEFNILKKEYTRQIKRGREYFFCSLSCSVQYTNSKRLDLRKKIKKVCPQCHKSFETMSGSKESTFCSRSCASAGSVTEKRRKMGKINSKFLPHTIEQIAKGLRRREWHKYKDIDKILNTLDIKHQFEYSMQEIGIFDLAIFEQKILIELDGKYHNNLKQKKVDDNKDALAKIVGWDVVRIPEESPQETIKTVLKIIL